MENKNKGLLAFAIVVIVAIVAIIYMIPDGSTDYTNENEEEEIAYVRRYVPSVTVTNVTADTIQTVGQPLASGDTLTTNESGYAMLLFLDETVARVSPSSQMVIRSSLNEQRNLNLRTQISLAIGGLFLDVQRGEDKEFEVTTSNTVASVKGTRFGVDADGYVWVEEGEVEVEVRETGELITLNDMSYVRVDETGATETGELTEEEIEELTSAYQILESDLIERQMRLQFRNQQGDTLDEDLRIFEQEDEEGQN
ncbi:MAG: FecR family protein [Balneolaceae bacterium]|nr:FecR family protein [Balneolaceae bacterium]